ncbi:MAG TPA: glycerophosphodiester phosphodiesterase [Candidatus Limnocylindria bacterium]
MRRIGHRGAAGHAPENTPEAFAVAAALGCDAVETDVWLVDGRLVVAHDRPEEVEAALRLDRTLELCRGLDLGVIVEVKAADGLAAERTGTAAGALIAAFGDRRISVSSFHWEALEAAGRAAPDVARAILYSDTPEPDAIVARANAAGLRALHPRVDRADAALVRRAHARGLEVYVWTVNDAAEVARCAALGVDGIMSDYPELVPASDVAQPRARSTARDQPA